MGMIDDDLNAPLGQYPIQKHPLLGRASHTKIALGALCLLIGVGLLGGRGAFFPGPGGLPGLHAATEIPATGTAVRDTPQRDEMPASLPAEPPPPPDVALAGKATAPLSTATLTATLLDPALGHTEMLERQSGVKIIRPGGGATPGALIIDVAKALDDGLAAAPDPRLIEQTRYGPVPRIGADGARPAEIYARPAVSLPGLPRIALLVGGMGLSSRATEAAIADLPGAVTLGFAPYGAGLARQTALAREAGHELVLEIPMEPFDFPRDNPGPHMLVAGAGKAGNSDNLTWLMSRFTGYAGVANFLGGKFTADEPALTPVLRAFATRGLFYVDDGTSARSLAMTLAPGQALAAARADIVLDSTGGPGAIDAALARLEAIARDKGLAIGVASALPDSIETIGRFARGLEARGIALVPLSATMPRPQSGVAEHQP
jgi:uncharacterized protein